MINRILRPTIVAIASLIGANSVHAQFLGDLDLMAEREHIARLYEKARNGAYAAHLAPGTKYLTKASRLEPSRVSEVHKECIPDGSLVLVNVPESPDASTAYVELLRESESSTNSRCLVAAGYVAVSNLERINRPAAEVISTRLGD